MDYEEQTEAIDELRQYIRCQVAGGFATRAQIIEKAMAGFSGEFEPVILKQHTERLTDEIINVHRKNEQAWPEVCDCGLDRAFEELEHTGIVCRQNFSCCASCGAAEIRREMEAARSSGREVIGYVFYDEQGTESAVEGYGLCLSYGSVLEGEASALHIAYQIVDALRRHGLKSEWNGSWDKRIVINLDWRRRRSSDSLGLGTSQGAFPDQHRQASTHMK
jgi:hypothetical protein